MTPKRPWMIWLVCGPEGKTGTYLLQWGHLNGRSPLCVRLCMVSAPVMEKAFPQPGWSHTYGSVIPMRGTLDDIMQTYFHGYDVACVAVAWLPLRNSAGIRYIETACTLYVTGENLRTC